MRITRPVRTMLSQRLTSKTPTVDPRWTGVFSSPPCACCRPQTTERVRWGDRTGSAVATPMWRNLTMEFLERGGVRIAYRVHNAAGPGTPMLLSHGFSATSTMWDRNVGALSADRPVVVWDQRGHGRSDSPV